jgi:hypothetical protein
MPPLDLTDASHAVAHLRDPATIRARSHALLALGQEDGLSHFHVHLDQLPKAAAYVADVIRGAYPTLIVPYHARWRHFAAGGIDRWGALASSLDSVDRAETARLRIDLCVISVLLDAGAGAEWRFIEPETGQPVTRSEGLAVASLHAFRAGLFSGNPAEKLRADPAGLARISAADISAAFQVTDGNPLVGVDGRATLMRGLGSTVAARPDLFGSGSAARIGGLYDHLIGQRVDGALPATAILAAILDGFGPIWPSRLSLQGQSLGDVWTHPGIVTPDLTNGLVPFHKLSQWMAYSLVEVFEDAGIPVCDLDQLTGLPEYRNGGLFLDLGVITLKDPDLARTALPVDGRAVVEWRALTVALLDLIADPVRRLLGKSTAEMPLACILEGGTWAAGRKIARERRVDGRPPLEVISDGTVF